MQDKLRRRYQVQKELSRNGFYEAKIALPKLTRLADLIDWDDQSDGEVVVSFEITRDEFDTPMIVGQLQTSLNLQCQRCLKPLLMPMTIDFRLMIDADDALVRKSSVDTLYSDDGYIDLYDVVEDELILALPLVALHENSTCNEHWQASAGEVKVATDENPFAVLRQLKTSE